MDDAHDADTSKAGRLLAEMRWRGKVSQAVTTVVENRHRLDDAQCAALEWAIGDQEGHGDE